jgi:hypothetical protein
MNLYSITTNNQEFHLFFVSACTYKNESKMHHSIQLLLDTALLLLLNVTSIGKADFNPEAQARRLGRLKHGAAVRQYLGQSTRARVQGSGPGARTQIWSLHSALLWDGDMQTGTVAALHRAGCREHGETARGGGKGDRTNANG